MVRAVAAFTGDRATSHRERGADEAEIDRDLEQVIADRDVRRHGHVGPEVALLGRRDRGDQPTAAVRLRNERNVEGFAATQITADLDRSARLDSLCSELEDELSVRSRARDGHKRERQRQDERVNGMTGRPEDGPSWCRGHDPGYGEPTGQAGAIVVSESVQWIRPWIVGLIRPPGWAVM